jgi:hypothetical protein
MPSTSEPSARTAYGRSCNRTSRRRSAASDRVAVPLRQPEPGRRHHFVGGHVPDWFAPERQHVCGKVPQFGLAGGRHETRASACRSFPCGNADTRPAASRRRGTSMARSDSSPASGLPASSFRSVAIAPVPFPSVPWHAAHRSFLVYRLPLATVFAVGAPARTPATVECFADVRRQSAVRTS